MNRTYNDIMRDQAEIEKKKTIKRLAEELEKETPEVVEIVAHLIDGRHTIISAATVIKNTFKERQL